MKPAATRMLLLQGGSAYRRLAAIVAGVALGVGLLLILLGGFLHMPDRDTRSAWVEPRGEWIEADDAGELAIPEQTADSMLLRSQWDTVHGETVVWLRIATAADTTVALPGELPVPAVGEYYASPGMVELIDSVPAHQVENRYGQRVGVLPDEMLAGPTQLAVISGNEWDAVAALSGSLVSDGFPEQPRSGSAGTYQIVLSMGAIAILVPIVLLISIVSQLGAAERRERFGTVRLIGAGRRAVAWVSAWEMAAASLVGGVLGVAVAAALRPFAAQLNINGTTSYIHDLTPSLGWTIATVLGVTVLAALTAWWRAFSDDVGAPGATRERAEKTVTGWHAAPLVLGIALFGSSTYLVTQGIGPEDVLNFGVIIGFAMIAFGIVLAGPWITRAASAGLRRFASSASAVVAAGRLERHPRKTFRSVAGLVVAVFVVSVFAGAATALQGTATPQDQPGLLHPDAVAGMVASGTDPVGVAEALRAVEGVEHVALGYVPEGGAEGVLMSREDAVALGAIGLPEAPGVIIDRYGMLTDPGASEVTGVDPAIAAPTVTTDELREVVVVTDGQDSSVERVRTALYVSANADLAPQTRAEYASVGIAQEFEDLSVMAYIGMGIAIGISALALTVATVAAALDRKRTFGLLRLAGMPVRQLRSTISIEAAVPLVVTLVASAGLGLGVAWAMVEALGGGLQFSLPGTGYWLAIASAIVIAAVAITASFGTVRRSTELASTRFE
ncbi:MAG: FtsX-like permease family protein [Demequina sp.]